MATNQNPRAATGGQAQGAIEQLSAPIVSTDSPGVKLDDVLTQVHLDHLVKGSGISPEVIAERGYRTVYGAKELEQGGFARNQRRGTGILIPLHAPDGTLSGYQYKPDHPRTDAKGKSIKYETPTGSGKRLDVPPRCRSALGNPAIPLWITEGVKKGDALATHGQCVVVVDGVWSFKGRNAHGAVTFLADWDYIALKDRKVYIVFDSDAATNPQVKKALERMAAHLAQKGASVYIVKLPGGEDNA